MKVDWAGGSAERIPAYATRVMQDPSTHIFSAQVYEPERAFAWTDEAFVPDTAPLLIYECHIGHSVGMHYVHYHGYATGMGVVDKRLKLLGGAETARRGKEPLLIYECHIGMAQEREGVGSYSEFRTKVLPRIAA